MCNFEKLNGKFRKETFVWGFVLIVMAAIAVGDIEQNSANVNAGEEIGRVIADSNSSAANIAADRTIQSISFSKDVRIRDALRFLAAKYQKNIVPSSKVDGVITVTNLYDVTFEEAMEAILGYGFKYDQDGNFVRVYTSEEYKKIKEDKGRMTYKVFTLYYINAVDAIKLLSPVLSGGGLIQGSAAAVAGISTTTGGGGGTEVGGDSMALHDTVVLYDYPENIAKAEEVIKSVDVRPQQVLVEATILSATLTEETAVGIDWSTLNGITVENIVDGTVGGADSSGFASNVTTTALESGGLSIGITKDHVAVLIKALESVTDVTILANPKIFALNKQVGTVFIGKKLGYRESSNISAGGTEVKGAVKFLDSGTKLSFRPYIGNDGYIRMDIYPKDSTATLNIEGVPTEVTAELVTNIIVKDGRTVVIGGLFREVTTEGKSQIPILGDIPFLGVLFRGTSDKNERQEVIVLLTPHIISEPDQAKGQAREEDISRLRYGAKEELQWVSRARLAEDRYANAVECYNAGNNKAALRELNTALMLRPTYLEALRLKDKIIAETNPDDVAKMKRTMLDEVDKKTSDKWRRK
jgi:type II secretory pathway component GspD/PulD (secretin)